MKKSGVCLYILVAIVLSSCFSEKRRPMNGELIFSNSVEIASFDLATGKKKSLYVTSEAGTSIPSISYVHSDTVLFEECNGLKTPNCMIRAINIKTNQVYDLRPGMSPSVLRAGKDFIFYDYSTDDHHLWMMMQDIQRQEPLRKIYDYEVIRRNDELWPYKLKKPVVISPTKVAVLSPGKELLFFDLSNWKSKKTGVKDCLPLAWRPDSTSFICQNESFSGYFEVNEQGKRRELLELQGATGLVYSAELDVIFFSKGMPITETGHIYAYDLKNGEVRKVISNYHIKDGVWIQ